LSRQFSHTLAAEFPEYVELNELLDLAAVTWPRFGLSAADLAELDDWTLEILRMSLDL
jgi:hypothetical protein